MSAMRVNCLRTKFTASALAVALSAGVLVLPAPASAAEDDAPLDTKILRGILEGLGLRKDGEAINYQERAPLVIPPGRTLPPPERTDAALANPAWPNDPDVQRRKAEAAQERKRGNAQQVILDESRPLRPDEMTPGPKPRNAGRSQTASGTPSNDSGNPLSPKELGVTGNLFKKMFKKDEEETAKFTGEAPRASLTDPPRGYQTPSPDQPYGVGKTAPLTKQGDYLTDHPVGSQ